MWRAGLAMVCSVLVASGGMQLQATSAREFAGGGEPAARPRIALPASPMAGLTTPTTAGPVQLILPAGLGEAVPTPDGVVVYPDHGAGLDMLAEPTGSGVRTVARILSADGVRMVTTFVRTPADTVMLAHTNGYLTINRATPTAETIGMFAPAETRDSTGTLVPTCRCQDVRRSLSTSCRTQPT